jgi:hypothetical protein
MPIMSTSLRTRSARVVWQLIARRCGRLGVCGDGDRSSSQWYDRASSRSACVPPQRAHAHTQIERHNDAKTGAHEYVMRVARQQRSNVV